MLNGFLGKILKARIVLIIPIERANCFNCKILLFSNYFFEVHFNVLYLLKQLSFSKKFFTFVSTTSRSFKIIYLFSHNLKIVSIFAFLNTFQNRSTKLNIKLCHKKPLHIPVTLLSSEGAFSGALAEEDATRTGRGDRT